MKHICLDKNLFSSCTHLENSYVILPDQSLIKVECCGDVQIGLDLCLKGVLFVPQFKLNLISVGALTADLGIVAQFYREFYTLQQVSTQR